MGTGNNNKITWAFSEKQDMIDMIETVYRGAKKGRGLVSGTSVAPVSHLLGKPVPLAGCQPQGLLHEVQVLMSRPFLECRSP